MRADFVAEAQKYQVFPLDASVAARIVAPRPNITAGRSEFVYTRPMVGLPQGSSPLLLNTSYTVTADITVPAGGAEGMLLTSGGRFGGYGFYLLKGKPVWTWNLIDLERIQWAGPDALAPGQHTVTFDFKYDGLGSGTLAYNDFSGVGKGGTGTLSVDGKVVATKQMEKTMPMILQWDESFDIGSDTETGVYDTDYTPPFTFTRHAEQADGQAGPAAALARGHQEDAGRAGGGGGQQVAISLPEAHRIESGTPGQLPWGPRLLAVASPTSSPPRTRGSSHWIPACAGMTGVPSPRCVLRGRSS